MRSLALCAAVMLLLVSAGGCFGPQKVTRHADDWLNHLYVDHPWLVGNTLSHACILFVTAILWSVDVLIVNPMDFWGRSAWPFGRGTGTPFNHRNPVLPAEP